MAPDLTQLITDGLDGAGIVIGTDSTPTRASELATAGARLFATEGPEPAVAALLTNDRPSIELVLGAIVSGGRILSLPLPPRSADLLAFGDFLEKTCLAHGVTSIVARDDIAALLNGIGMVSRPHSTLGTEPIAAPTPGGFELVQFSSGSTGRPKGVALPGAVLGINVAAILQAVRPQPHDVTVSWLPLSHDMGLIGMLLTSVAACSPSWVGEGTIVITEPESFLRSPGSWLANLDRWGGTFTAAPDFGYRLAVQRRPTGPLNLRRLRCAIVGGEIIRADTLHAVTEAFAADGLTPESLCPAYGLAELGLAASMSPPTEHWRTETLEIAALGDHRRVAHNGDAGGISLVASGLPLDGYRIEVQAGPDEIGAIDIMAPAAGNDAATGRPLANAEGLLATGDIGYLSEDGWVYVCGRGDDHLVAHGRNIYAPVVESAVSNVPGVRDGRVTAIGTPTGEWIIAAELDGAGLSSTTEIARLRQEVRRAAVSVSTASPDEVILLRPGTLPMTSSGKLQRHEVRRRWLNGALDST